MKNVKKLLIVCLMVCIIFSNTSIVHAQDIQTNIATEMLDMYADVMVNREITIYDNIFANSEEKDFFYSFMKWRIAIMEILDVGYSSFEYTINNIAVEHTEDSIVFLINFNETHNYDNGITDCVSTGLILGVEIDTLKEDYKLLNLYLINDELYDYFMQQMQTINQYTTYTDSEISTFDTLIEQLYNLKREMDAVSCKQKEQLKEATTNAVVPLATGYTYSGSRGAAYANKYVENRNTSFYDAGLDCTNFVSQCIWAGYGGWMPTMDDSTMVSNITSKVRMTSTWYGGQGGGSPAWEQVDKLWDYVVGNTGNGPKAYGYNSGGHYSEILPIDICVGDVLQKSSNGSDYTHSMYVISTVGGSDPLYSEIVIAQHTSNTTKTLAEALINATYMRHMQFMYNTFDS